MMKLMKMTTANRDAIISFGLESPAGGTPDVALHPSLLRRTQKYDRQTCQSSGLKFKGEEAS